MGVYGFENSLAPEGSSEPLVGGEVCQSYFCKCGRVYEASSSMSSCGCRRVVHGGKR